MSTRKPVKTLDSEIRRIAKRSAVRGVFLGLALGLGLQPIWAVLALIYYW